MSNSQAPERKESHRSRSSGRRLSRRFARWPLLRLMIESPAFRYVVLAFLLAAIAAPSMLLKLWRVDAPDDQPIPRISTLDYVQAWSLKRNAREAEARGDYQNALSAWRAAAANNPADLVALRGGLHSILRSPQPAEAATTAANVSAWLLRMGRTNLADVELVATTLLRCELHDSTALLLTRLTNVTSATLNRLQAVALIRSGRVNDFRQLLRTDPALEAAVQQVLEDPAARQPASPVEAELRMVSLAYLAGWGPPESHSRALAALQATANDPALETLARELEMMVYLQLRDLAGSEKTFRSLRDAGRASILHLAMYGSLLVLEGKKSDAVSLLREVNPVPKTDSDVFRLITLLTALDLDEEADQLCQRYFSDPPWIEEGALLRTDLLTRMKRWDELRRLAYRIRVHPATRESLGGFSYYLEGLAEWREGYRSNAIPAFDTVTNASKSSFPDPRLVVRVGEALLELGLPKHAESLLLPRRGVLNQDPAFLTLLVRCAYSLKQTDYLWDTITNLYALTPNNPSVVNNYGASLLLFRRQPEEAIVHTLRLLQAYPNSPEILLNHAVALTMNGRLAEADDLLLRVLPEALTPEVRAQYDLALFELRLLQGRMDEARAIRRTLDTTQLYPVQIQWLETNTPPPDARPETAAQSSDSPGPPPDR